MSTTSRRAGTTDRTVAHSLPVREDPPDLVRLLRSQSGALTRSQALGHGLTPKEIRWRLASGRWRRAHRGVFVTEDSPRASAWAAQLAAGGAAAVSGPLAAAVLGLQPMGEIRPEVSGPDRIVAPGLRSRRRVLAPEDIVCAAGLRLTSPLRTVLDLLTDPSRLNAVWTAEQALRLGLVRRDDVATRLAGRCRGVRLARDRWLLVDERSESPLETAVRLTLRDHGLPPPELQVPVRDEDGEPFARLDLYWPAHRVAVEADGREPHSRPEALFLDRYRQNRLLTAGIRVLRATWEDVRHPAALCGQVWGQLAAGPGQAPDAR